MTDVGARSLTRVLTLHARHRYTKGGPQDAHGHLYRIEVTVHSRSNVQRGTIIDLATFDRILDEQLVHRLAGRLLNDAVPEFASGEDEPSCEAMAAWCWRQVAPRLPAEAALERVRVAEDDTLWADCTAG